jgi:hypothetical protein
LALWSAAWSCLRLCEAAFFWKVLEEYNASPLYIAISGGFWLIASIFLALGIWLRKTRNWVWSIVFLISYASWYWVDRLIVQLPNSNWPFSLAVTVLLAGICSFILLSTKTRAYFKKSDTSHE